MQEQANRKSKQTENQSKLKKVKNSLPLPGMSRPYRPPRPPSVSS